MNTLARVFSRRTKATPNDDMAFFGPPDLFTEAKEVHIDVTFTADKPRCGKTKLREPFTVSHVPSGTSVRTDIPLETARRLATRLQPVPAFEAVQGPAWLKAKPRICKIVRAA